MFQKGLFIFSFFLGIMFLVSSTAQCENWKEYFNDAEETLYYDKDSVHYPKAKKVFGLTVRNKEIVNVWIRTTDKKSRNDSDSNLITIYCATREWAACERESERNMFEDLIPPFYGKGKIYGNGKIKPGDRYESLLKKVCP